MYTWASGQTLDDSIVIESESASDGDMLAAKGLTSKSNAIKCMLKFKFKLNEARDIS
jgi:hypothetical protein